MAPALRPATLDDLEAILHLNEGLFTYEKGIADHDYNQDWTYSEEGKKYFSERIQNKNSIFLVAEVDKKIVAYLLAFISTLPYRRVNPICEIENMTVTEDFRSRGVGEELMKAVKQETVKRGVKRLRVGTIAQNLGAIKFYRSHGFTDMNLYMEVKI